jgi:hypothetical protein
MSIRRAQDERIEGTPDGLNAVTEISDVPDAPTIGAATNVGTSRAYNNGSATVAYTAAATGGTVVTFTATSTPGSFTATGASPITVTGLQSGTAYTFTVKGTNTTATGADSSASSSITATTVPQAPTIGTPTAGAAGSGQISVAFTAGETGGSTITGFTATSTPGSITGTSATSPITVSGLTPGTSYTFTVTATNANGTSTASSASSSVTATEIAQAGFVAGGLESDGLTRKATISKILFSNDTISTLAAGLSSAVQGNQAHSNSGTAGYVAGGLVNTNPFTPISTMNKLTYSSDAVSTLGSGLTAGRYDGIGFANSGSRGYIVAGQGTGNSYFNLAYNRTVYSNDTTSSLSFSTGGLVRKHGSFANSGTAGYIFGGLDNDNARQNSVRKIAFSNDAFSFVSNNLSESVADSAGCANSGTAGYRGGGIRSNGTSSVINKLTFSNDTISTVTARLPSARGRSSAFAKSGTAGYWASGYTTGQTTITKLSFSNDSVSTLAANITSHHEGSGFANSGTL